MSYEEQIDLESDDELDLDAKIHVRMQNFRKEVNQNRNGVAHKGENYEKQHSTRTHEEGQDQRAGETDIKIPLTSFANTSQNIACISFLLGCLGMLGLVQAMNGGHCELLQSVLPIKVTDSLPWTIITALFRSSSSSPQVGIYIFFLSVFHLLEFVTTATWNPSKAKVDSFLINNGLHYHIAHFVALSEFVIEECLLGTTRYRVYKHDARLISLGLVFVLVGQWFRSKAMITASTNFSHILAESKATHHQLVQAGVYSFSRHPSYLGFFLWVLGLQLVLCNPVSLPVLVGVTWGFFSERIEKEEKYLVTFFGQEYIEYKSKVPTWIPFIK